MNHDRTGHKAIHGRKHSSPALSPLPRGKHFSLFHLPRIPQDARTLSRLRSKVRPRARLFSRRHVWFSYGLGIVIVALTAALLWLITGWWITKDIIWAVVLFLPFAPTITLFARVLWIYLDQAIDPERES